MLAALGEDAAPYIRRDGSLPSALGGEAAEKYHLDLKQLNALWLRRAGVSRIDVSCDCTRCRPDRFWSHRFAGQERGSMAAVIMLKE